jgi:hypothetical protein
LHELRSSSTSGLGS